MILNSTKPSTGNKDSIGMPTLHFGPRGTEEYHFKVKGFIFIVIVDEDSLKASMHYMQDSNLPANYQKNCAYFACTLLGF